MTANATTNESKAMTQNITASMQKNIDWLEGTLKGTQYTLREASEYGPGYYMMEATNEASPYAPSDTMMIQLTRRGTMNLWNLSIGNTAEHAAKNQDARRVVCIVARPVG